MGLQCQQPSGRCFCRGNYQIGSFVLGAEGDIEALRVKGGFYDPAGAGDTRMDWQGSFRGRAGFAVSKALIYGTGVPPSATLVTPTRI